MGRAVVDHGAEKQREHGQTDNLKREHWPLLKFAFFLLVAGVSGQVQIPVKGGLLDPCVGHLLGSFGTLT
jgi:hypothetical protein